MKRMLTMTTAAAMLCTMLCGSLSAGAAEKPAAPEPMKIRLMQDFSYAARDPKLEIGDSIKVENVINVSHSNGTAVLSETQGALGSVNAATFDSEDTLGFAEGEGKDCSFEVFYQGGNGLSDLTGWMAYVKMPVNKAELTKADGYHPNDHKGDGYSALFVGHWAYKEEGNVQAWPRIQGSVQYLEKNGAQWQTTTANDGIVNLPNGFEGYVKMNLDDLTNLTEENAAAMEGALQSTTFKYRSFGGDVYGPAVVNAIYGIVEDSDSVTALVSGEETARFLNGGKTVDEAADATLIDAAMKGRVLQSFNAYEEGADLLASGGVRAYGFPDLTATIVPKRGGIDDSPALKLDGETQRGYRDGGPWYEFDFVEQMSAEELEGVMFYVECTPAHKADLAEGRDIAWVGPTLYSVGGTTGEKWSKLGNGKTVKVLAEGSKKWTQVAAGGGLLQLPASFKGYILIDLDDLVNGDTVESGSPVFTFQEDRENRKVAGIHLGFHAIGGDAGAGYIDAMYGITDMGEKDILMTLNECDVYNLTTGKPAAQEDLLEKGPEIGEAFDDIPEATLEEVVHEVGEDDLTATSVKLSWDAIEGAAAYRADIFRTEAASDGISLKYVCTASKKTTDTSLTIDGLEANTRYYAVVNVLDEFDGVKDVLGYQRFMTPDTVVVPDPDTDPGTNPGTDPGTEPVPGGDKDPIPDTGVPMASSVIVMAAAAAAAVIVSRKKRDR